jgi:hypothetical protein
LAAVFAIAVLGIAWAATSDPYLYPYDEGLDIPHYTYVLEATESDQSFFLSPSVVEARDAPPSYFSSDANAEDYSSGGVVSWDIIFDTPLSLGNPSSTSVAGMGYDAIGDETGWMNLATVTIPTGTYGSLSVMAENTATGVTTNVTIVRQEDPPTYISAGGVGVRVVDPVSGIVYSADQMAVQAVDFHENTDRTFPTGLDGIRHADLYVPAFKTNVTDITYDYVPNLGDYVKTMTIGGKTYPDEDADDDDGWLYRVYRATGANHTVAPLSGYVGADSILLRPQDIILWKYASFDVPGLVPTTIP